MKQTDVDAVESVSDERSFAHIVFFVVDLQPPHAASESTSCSGLQRRFADVLESSKKQLSAKRHSTEQSLHVETSPPLQYR